MYQVVVKMNDLIIHNLRMDIASWVRLREQLMIKDDLCWCSHQAVDHGLKLKYVETWKGKKYVVTTEMR